MLWLEPKNGSPVSKTPVRNWQVATEPQDSPEFWASRPRHHARSFGQPPSANLRHVHLYIAHASLVQL